MLLAAFWRIREARRDGANLAEALRVDRRRRRRRIILALRNRRKQHGRRWMLGIRQSLLLLLRLLQLNLLLDELLEHLIRRGRLRAERRL